MRKIIVKKHFNKVAVDYDKGKRKYDYYYSNLKLLLSELIGRNKNVLEVGCGTGDLLAALEPKSGYGFDVSEQMIKLSKAKYSKNKNLHFSTKSPKTRFDYIFMSDVIEHLVDHGKEFLKIKKLMHKNSKFIITMANPIWEPLLLMWEKLDLKMKEGPHKRIGYKDVRIIGDKSGLTITKHDFRLLVPINVPLITYLSNKYLEPILKPLAFIEYFVLEKV